MNIEAIKLSSSAAERISAIKQKPNNQNKLLRIAVLAGGCNGFQYTFELTDEIKSDDIKIYQADREFAVVDSVSAQFLNGATLDFVDELGAAYFQIKNPNSKSSCGCGSSFSV